MRIVAIKQCDAWEPVSKRESALAGKRALHPGVTYDLTEGTQFSAVPAIPKDRTNRPPGPIIDLEKAVKEGLIKRLSEKVAS